MKQFLIGFSLFCSFSSFSCECPEGPHQKHLEQFAELTGIVPANVYLEDYRTSTSWTAQSYMLVREKFLRTEASKCEWLCSGFAEEHIYQFTYENINGEVCTAEFIKPIGQKNFSKKVSINNNKCN